MNVNSVRGFNPMSPTISSFTITVATLGNVSVPVTLITSCVTALQFQMFVELEAMTRLVKVSVPMEFVSAAVIVARFVTVPAMVPIPPKTPVDTVSAPVPVFEPFNRSVPAPVLFKAALLFTRPDRIRVP